MQTLSRVIRAGLSAATAFAFALQLILSAVLVSHAQAATIEGGSPFVICYGNSAAVSGPEDAKDRAPSAGAPCIFCILAKAPVGILPDLSFFADLTTRIVIKLTPPHEQVRVAFRSPTGFYVRGPPQGPALTG